MPVPALVKHTGANQGVTGALYHFEQLAVPSAATAGRLVPPALVRRSRLQAHATSTQTVELPTPSRGGRTDLLGIMEPSAGGNGPIQQQQQQRQQQRRPRRFVGDACPLAGEFHSSDFDWHEHAAACAPLLRAQEQQAALAAAAGAVGALPDAVVRPITDPISRSSDEGSSSERSSTDHHAEAPSTASSIEHSPTSSTAVGPSHLPGAATQHGPDTNASTSTQHNAATNTSSSLQHSSASPISTLSGPAASTHTHRNPPTSTSRQQAALSAQHAIINTQHAATSTGTSTSISTSTSSSTSTNTSTSTVSTSTSTTPLHPDDAKWEVFYRQHPRARFFKQRRYLLLEFPALQTARHVIELGCGCGSSLLPVLTANASARATAFDVSATSVQQLLDAATAAGIAPGRIDAFVADAADGSLATGRLAGVGADAALIMYTLSAVMPDRMVLMLRNAYAALAPGGVLMLRDHGLYDMVQLRIPAHQRLGPNLYRREDGTLAYFFTTEELSALAEAAGFAVVECSYVCVINHNRKTGQKLRRVFVHGVFQRPQQTRG